MKIKNKSKLLLITLGLIAYTSANAASDNRHSEIKLHVLECSSEKLMPGTGIQVTINQIIKRKQKKLEAVVTELIHSMHSGPQLVGKFIVTRKAPDPKAEGGAIYYQDKSENFMLMVVPTGTPINGGMPAHLIVNTENGKGRRISETMFCRLTRSL
ncbi:MAG: hypothetical protein AABZ06_05500 [Bdellovibrionota bacterium]